MKPEALSGLRPLVRTVAPPTCQASDAHTPVVGQDRVHGTALTPAHEEPVQYEGSRPHAQVLARRPRPGLYDTHPCARGQALIAALLLVTVLAAGALLANGDLRARAEAVAHARSLEALAQARSALIGYAISYEERHPGEGYGFMPCPDSGNDGSTPIGACGARGVAAIGRLPWRTLGLPDLRDGWGECLWYAVAGSAKHNPKPLTHNWDSPGQFAIRGDNGSPLPVASADGRAVAVIFAPGPALETQHRGNRGSGPCSGGDSALSSLDAFIDQGTEISLAGPSDIHQGRVGGVTRNDLIAWLGIDDIYDALRRRSDFALYIDRIGERASTHLAPRLADAHFIEAHTRATAGALVIGELPAAAALMITEPAAAAAHDNWRDQFRFAACEDASACIRLIDPNTSQTRHCRAVLLFGGERIRHGAQRQQRNTAAQRADITQYLEDDNPRHYLLGVPEFHGIPAFQISDASRPATEDVVRCLN